MKLQLNQLAAACVLSIALLSPAVHAASTVPAASVSTMPNVYRIPLAKGVSMDDAVESMKLRANELNLKLVAELPLSKQVEAMVGGTQRRMEIYQFCDALTAKDLVDMNVDFAIYLPCRIALIEDNTGKAWLVMMDMDVPAWSKASHMSPELTAKIMKVRNGLIEIVNAGANGDL
ncbi:DUF302 domain-containing protein [Sulfuriferula nivalis]|uniref:DUF302 domain-containing protein n=1 Tax=Sulfuriferula nivalis TaxID=2675298 RepID=A0A809RKQ4_9PROT|nr:DUF302 domain-containing protein [Sulfuriferula nivalis]BBP01384.1 hypothetical protein SFSGTM_20920 [Sulfuriferula nivalis]